MRQFFILSLCFFALISCKQELNTEEQNLYDEVMVIHDEVMPKTKDIYRKQKALKNIQETLDKAEDQILVRKAITALEEADEMMFDWMGEFKQRKDLPEGRNYLEYLKKEKIRIQAVSDAMLNSIATAEEIIKQFADE